MTRGRFFFAPSSTAILLTLAACQAADQPVAGSTDDMGAIPEYSIEQFLASTNVFGSSFSPTGDKILVSSDETGIYNAYAIPVDGSPPVQLTHSANDAVRVAGYFPTDERFLYLSDQGGNELHHLFVRELDGSATDLTPGENLKANFLDWALDDESFFIGTNERDSRFFDIYEVSAADYERTLVFRNEEGFNYGAVSPDERYIALSKTKTTSDSDIYLYDRLEDKIRHLTPHEGEVVNDPQAFSPDASALYMRTDEGSEFAYLARIDLETGERESVVETDWDVWYAYFSRPGNYLILGINENARTRIRAYEYPSLQEIDLPDAGVLDITSVGMSDDESRLAFYASTPRTPRNLYVASVEGEQGSQPKRLTDTLNPEIDPEHLVTAEPVRFASYDGVEIPGILYRPHSASADTPVPALVWVHGGPGGQSRIGYSNLIQYLVNHGYAVYAINNRGSMRGQQGDAYRDRVGGSGPNRHRRGQLRRIHGAGRPDLPTRGVRRRCGPVRHLELGENPREHPSMVGVFPRGALSGDGRSGRRQAGAIRQVAPLPRGPDPAAADGPAGCERPQGHPGRVR
jgi:dipeptidyl aminopeptidase/acylaminoacyl peptidase